MGPGRLRKLQSSPDLLSYGILAVALLAGCSNSIKGEIERQEIKVKSAFFFQQDAVLGTDGLIGIVLTDVPKGCETWTSYLTATAAAPDAPSKAAAWAANFPADFWEVNILLRVPSTATPLAGAVPGAVWNEGLTLAPQVKGGFTHRLFAHDIAYFDGTGDLNLYRKDYVTNGGSLAIDGHTPGAAISGLFPAYTKDLDGVDTGLVEIKFNAEFCATADLLDNAGLTQPAAR